ncbi:MAG: FGGY-family carbohydrate kinase [Dehalococcoidia bacterium]|nr:FGGY-family carbohydrate kinase [Dehalococcoidia bacterium]
MARYIVAHDVGTSGNKAVLVDAEGRVHGRRFESYRTDYPKPGWAEQEPADWWKAVTQTTRLMLDETGVSPKDVLCVTFSTQMLGIVPMDAERGPLRPAIIWLDNRAGKQASRMMRKFISAGVFALIAGTALGGKDGIPKLLWLKNEEPEIYENMRCFLDVDGYLIYRSTGNMVMEWSCASVFGIDLKKKKWLDGVFRYVGLDPEKLPPLVRSIDQVGVLSSEASKEYGLLEGTPVIAGAGDAPCAAVGSGAVGEGEGHVYLGTSGWVGVVTERMPQGKHGAASVHSADPNKAFLFAETETAGACLQWIADEFYKSEKMDPNIPNVYALMDEKVSQIPPGSDYLLFTPWMYGERVPVDDHYVRSSFLNLSADHTRENLLRAVYEGVAYNIRWIVDIVEKEFHFPLPELRVVGGGAKGEPWMQILADVTHRKVETMCDPQDAGAVGVALIAAVGLGLYPDFESLRKVVKVEKVFEPRAENSQVYDSLFRSYQEVYGSLRSFYAKLNKKRFDEAKVL